MLHIYCIIFLFACQYKSFDFKIKTPQGGFFFSKKKNGTDGVSAP